MRRPDRDVTAVLGVAVVHRWWSTLRGTDRCGTHPGRVHRQPDRVYPRVDACTQADRVSVGQPRRQVRRRPAWPEWRVEWADEWRAAPAGRACRNGRYAATGVRRGGCSEEVPARPAVAA